MSKVCTGWRCVLNVGGGGGGGGIGGKFRMEAGLEFD
jgi:hypothetical protein